MKNICAIFTLFVLFSYSCSTDPIEVLQEGIEIQDLEKIKSALSDIPDANIVFTDGTQPLQKAIAKDNLEIVQLLLTKGAEVTPENNAAPLLFATSADMVDFLIKKGADVNTRDSIGNTLLHTSKDVAIIKLLLQHQANLNQQNKQRETPLIKAAQSGDTDVFIFLLEHGADTSITDRQGRTAIDQIIPNSGIAIYWKKEKERQKREVEKKRQEEEEKRRKLALQNAFPAKGKTGYICNYGTACQVLIKEVAGGKVKIEVLEKC